MSSPAVRLSKAQRRAQLLETARLVVRDEGVDKLTLGCLAAKAGVSKPIAYEHFQTRSGLLIELYKAIDAGKADQLRLALAAAPRDFDLTVNLLADAYMHCYADDSGEWHAVGAALSGNDEMDAVHKELVDSYVELFIDALTPCTDMASDRLRLRCVGLVGAGEALSGSMVRGEVTEAQAAEAFAALMRSSLI